MKPMPGTSLPTPVRRRATLRQRGVSLVEALLALVVMSVGMLAVAGVQTTLRANGDLSRQRAEAVRIAQQSIEQRRGFVRVDETGTVPDYTDLESDSALSADVVAGRVNTAFTVARTVTEPPLVTGTLDDRSPPMKTVVLRVGWDDRNGQRQGVSLFTTIAKSSPEIAGSLVVPPQGSPARRPLGRQVAIPLSAEAIRDEAGKSLFRLPRTGEGIARGWVFDDLTGLIERVCSNADDLSSCTVTTAQLVTGFVRLALPSTVAGDPAAMGADAARDPGSTRAELDAFLRGRALTVTALYRTSASPTASYREECVIDRAGTAGAPEYFCALPLYPSLRGTVPTWDGRIVFGPTPDPVAASPGETSADRLRACRYVVAPGERADDGYTGVAGPLSQQNFVLARAGSGSVAYGCPGGAEVSVAQGPG